MASSTSPATSDFKIAGVRNFFPAGMVGVIICVFSALVFLGAASAAAI